MILRHNLLFVKMFCKLEFIAIGNVKSRLKLYLSQLYRGPKWQLVLITLGNFITNYN